MTLYMVVHCPNEHSEEHTNPPTRLREMAQECGKEDSVPRWVNTYAPDLNDDRIFSMWESPNADSVMKAIERFGFLDHLDPKVFAVREWGPPDVLASSGKDE